MVPRCPAPTMTTTAPGVLPGAESAAVRVGAPRDRLPVVLGRRAAGPVGHVGPTIVPARPELVPVVGPVPEALGRVGEVVRATIGLGRVELVPVVVLVPGAPGRVALGRVVPGGSGRSRPPSRPRRRARLGAGAAWPVEALGAWATMCGAAPGVTTTATLVA